MEHYCLCLVNKNNKIVNDKIVYDVSVSKALRLKTSFNKDTGCPEKKLTVAN